MQRVREKPCKDCGRPSMRGRDRCWHHRVKRGELRTRSTRGWTGTRQPFATQIADGHADLYAAVPWLKED